ncbi:MAG TPA: 50S ribosomal protein L9 [Anaerolineae bacterium]|nr:50S ribosomal protein L9 [Anaerolineae bacterium]
MKVLLTRDVTKLGKAGTVKTVADGYARNYLLAQGLAVLATAGAVKQADSLAKSEQKRQSVLAADASSLAEQLQAVTLTFHMRAGEEGKLYGSVTSANIVDELKRTTGLDIDRHKLELREPLRSLGTHKVAVRLASELAPEITVNVAREEAAPSEPAAA